MAKITRFNGNVKAIASESQAGERYVFGSTSVTSDDLTDQMTNAILRGWATVGPSDFPPLEWFNSVAFTATQFNAYLHQTGVAEWDALQEYNIGSITNKTGALYASISDSNIGNDPLSSPSDWDIISAKDTAEDLSTDGYKILPGGLIFQWGYKQSSVAADTAISVTFPIAFPNASLSVVAQHSNSGATTEKSMVNIYSPGDTISFDYRLSASGTQAIYWQAIGY